MNLFLLFVTELPSSPPVISVTHKPFDYDDVLRANCSSPPSRPQAILRMSLNKIVVSNFGTLYLSVRLHFNMGIISVKTYINHTFPPFQIGRTDMTLAQKSQEPVWSDLNVEITISEFFFKQAGERLILECVAQVAGYESNAVLELASARHPVPERGLYLSTLPFFPHFLPYVCTYISLVILTWDVSIEFSFNLTI